MILATATATATGARIAAQVPEGRGRLTFTRDIAPILFARCAGCHRPDGPAPFQLLTYEDARRRAKLIAAVTASRYMPPWKPEPGHGEFAGARRLSDEEIARLQQWVADGTIEGRAADLPPQPHWPAGWQLGEPDLVLTLPEYVVPAEGADIFRNFVVAAGGGATRYVRGVEMRTGNRAVHHATIRVDRTPNARRFDNADPLAGYEGIIPFSAEHPSGQFVGWTPGQVPAFAPKGLSWPFAPASDLVVQLHLQPTGTVERVRPSIGIFFTREAPVRTPLIVRLGSQKIDIPAGDASYRTHDEFVLPVDAQVQSIQPHAHYRAREVSARATLPDGSTRSLILIRDWDFNWQDVYRYADPFWLPAGTRIEATFTFDNSATNPRNPRNPPQRVVWGPGSADEMGDVMLQVLTRDDAQHERLARAVRSKMLMQEVDGLELQIAVDPGRAGVRTDLADAYVQLGRPDRAVPHFEAVTRLDSASAAAWHNLGVALQATGALEQASAAYAQALARDDAHVDAHINRGLMLFAQGELAGAQAHYARAAALAPRDARPRNNLGGVLIELGRADEAVGHLREALRLRPAFPEAHYLLGRAHERRDQPREALRHYREALTIATRLGDVGLMEQIRQQLARLEGRP